MQRPEDEMNFYIHLNSRDWFGEVCVPVARDRCPRASDAQQLSDRRCIVRSRWECGVDFDDISGLNQPDSRRWCTSAQGR